MLALPRIGPTIHISIRLDWGPDVVINQVTVACAFLPATDWKPLIKLRPSLRSLLPHSSSLTPRQPLPVSLYPASQSSL